jgi:hypothetical protein
VAGLRLSCSASHNPTFLGWGRATLALAVGTPGKLALASLGVVEAVRALRPLLSCGERLRSKYSSQQ